MPAKTALRVPSYRRHKPTGQAVVTLSGKDHYLGKWNTAASRAGGMPAPPATSGLADRRSLGYPASCDLQDAVPDRNQHGVFPCYGASWDEKGAFCSVTAPRSAWGTGTQGRASESLSKPH